MGNRRMTDGDALARGRRAAEGVRRGRRRFAGPKGPQNQSRGGGQGPPPLLCARWARPPPPLAAGAFPYQASGPLPMSGPPAYSAGNQQPFSSWFSPAFSKAGQGLGAEPPTGSRGSAPGGVRGSAPAAASRQPPGGGAGLHCGQIVLDGPFFLGGIWYMIVS